MAGSDYYSILGISKSASDKEIKQAYRRLARKLHPDVNPADKKAEEEFKKINEAYEVLSDPEKRKKYDQFGDNWQRADQFAGAGNWGQGRTTQTTEGFDFSGLGDFDSIFDSILGRRGASRRTSRGSDIEHPVEVTLEEAYNGTSRLLRLQVEESCPSCGGKGSRNGRCSACLGAGLIMRNKRIEVKIPPSVADGSRVKITGAGSAGRGGGPTGDLYLVISVRPHQKFERKGNDLYTDVAVPFLTAILGGEVEVPTLTSKVALKIPPETQNGRVFRLSGMGMPHLNRSGKGDLYAKVSVVLPSKLSEKQKRLFEELSAIS